jgi:hypothetical protein
MNFKQPREITRDEINEGIASDDLNLVSETLVRMSLYESDWKWAEQVCLECLKSDRTEIKVAALIAIGHIARRFRILHLDLVLPAINNLLRDSQCSGIAEDICEDIAMFVTIDKPTA